MEGKNDISHEATSWRKEGNTSLAKIHMDTVVKEGCDGVAQKGGQEDQRDDYVCKSIVRL